MVSALRYLIRAEANLSKALHLCTVRYLGGTGRVMRWGLFGVLYVNDQLTLGEVSECQ